MGSSYGVLFRITTFGESHGPGLGVVIDGCPPRLALDVADVQRELDRRRPGQSRRVSQRKEEDQVEILSGVLDGLTLGTPIAMLVRNQDTRSKDYEAIARAYRPSHADFTYDAKYGIRAIAGGGRASARETVGRVAAGAVAQQVLAAHGIAIVAWVDEVAGIACGPVDGDTITRHAVDANDIRCPDEPTAARMIERVEQARKDGDSVGGVIRAVARNVPAGWGEPVFDKLDADVAKAMMSIPAVKGVEIGSGFAGTLMTGSTHNDVFVNKHGAIGTRTNRSGGIQGGISNGEPVTVRIAFKPTATIMRPQATVGPDGNPTVLEPKGRHDPCVLPRAIPIVEAMLALVLADHCLRQKGHTP